MINAFSLQEVEEIARVPLQIAGHVSEEDLAVLGQVPLYPAVFDHVNGVRDGDTRYTNQYFELLSLSRTVGMQGRLDPSSPDSLIASARNLEGENPNVSSLLVAHDESVRERLQIVRDLRSEALSLSRLLIGEIEQLDDGDVVPLFVQEGQISALGLINIQATRDTDRGGAILVPTKDTKLIVVTDTSESTTANLERYAELRPEDIPRGFSPLDLQFQRALEPEEVDDLIEFNGTTYRVLPNIGDCLPQLITSQGWRG